jgi:hypothetical protein
VALDTTASVLRVSVHAWFSNDDAPLAPGDSLTLALTVHNLGNETASCTILPAGLTATWTTISQGRLILPGGSQQTVEVEVRPPAAPTTTAGPTTIAVRVVPFRDADAVVVAEATLLIEPFDDLRLVPLQPIQRARHRANFEFMTENHGNSVASCRLHLVDVSDRVDGDFDPPAVGLAPGAASLVLLKTRARRGGFRRGARTLGFEIEAARQGMAPVSTPLTFVQSPTIPPGSIARIATVLALVGAVVVGWLAVVEPAIEEAAADRVDARIAELAPVEAATAAADAGNDNDSGTGDDESTDMPTGTVPGGDAPAGPVESTFFRLPVNAPLTQTADQSTTMAEGRVFDMTDVRIENPFNDRGVATLLVNGETVFIWSLANVRGSHFEPRLTPIRLAAGDNVTFSVRCDEIGDISRATCTTAINVGGESRPDGDV